MKMVYGFGDHSKMKDKRRYDGYQKWNGSRGKSRDDKAEGLVSRHMTSTLLSFTFNKFAEELAENKNGMCIYDGRALTLPEWEFKTNTQIRAYCTKYADKSRKTSAELSAENTPQKSEGSYTVTGRDAGTSAAS